MENEAWTTALGRELLRLESNGADYATICSLEQRLQVAFNAVKHVRKCFNKQTSVDHLPLD